MKTASKLRVLEVDDLSAVDRREWTLGDLFSVFRRRRVYLTWSVGGLLLLVTAYCLLATPRYQATSEIEVQKESPGVFGLESSVMGNTSNADADSLDYSMTLETEANILQSSTLALDVIKNLSLETTKDYYPAHQTGFQIPGWLLFWKKPVEPLSVALDDAPNRRYVVLKIFANHLKITPVPGTRLIEVSYSDPDPRIASMVVNRLVQALMDYTFQARFNATVQASTWLGDQLTGLKKQTEALQEKAIRLQRDTGMFGDDESQVQSWGPFSTESPSNRRITTSTTATRVPHTDRTPDQRGKGMRMLKSLWIGLLIMTVICCACPSRAQTSANQTHESLLIGPGDLLRVTVLRESDLTQNVRVRDSGEVRLPLIGNVQVRGLSAAEAAAAIASRYVEGQFLKHPDVSVFVEEYATQPVSVLGQVVKPGLISISTPRSLVDVLAMAGGLTDQADRHITVERGGNARGLEEVFLSNRPEDALNANVEIFPGDKILVPKAGIVYVLGDVGKPGGYLMQNNSRLTVLEAVAMAAGVNRTASENRARVIHNENGQYQERELLLKNIQEGKAPDQLLEADDVIYIPFSFGKNILMGTNSIVAATSSALIYAGH